MDENMSDPSNKYRLAHTMIRVSNLDKSLDFYTRLLGMQVLRQKEYPDGKFTNTFVGYGPEDSHTVIELTYNWEQETPYDRGNAWGHLALEVPDAYATCAALEAEGVSIPRPAGPMKHGARVIAFIEDPDGYKIELIEPLP